MKRLLITLSVLFLFISAIPITNSEIQDESPEVGTFTVNITNHLGDDDFIGSWNLKETGATGVTVRNGMKSDTFDVEPGNYVLTVNNVNHYNYHLLDIDNEQTMEAYETIVYNVTYFKTQEDLDARVLGIEIREDDTEPPAEDPSEEPENRPEDEPEPEVEPPVEEPEVTVIPIYAPDFDTPPDSSAASADEYDLGAVAELAQTGSGLLFILIPSMLGGLLFSSRRKR